VTISNSKNTFSTFGTPLHDAIHLWLDDIVNQRKLVCRLSSQMGILGELITRDDIDVDSSVKTQVLREENLYSSNDYHIGTIDAILYSQYYCPQCQQTSPVRRTIIEIKPKLDSITKLIPQVDKYRHYLPSQKQLNEKSELYLSGLTYGPVQDTDAIVLTLSDQTGRFDDILYRKGIRVYRVNREELELDDIDILAQE
jgi:hypothetical protein